MQETGRQKRQERAWLKTMASPLVVFCTLPWLMVLLILGTVLQRDLGLFDAQKLFFSSWVLWFGPIPLPGAYTTLGVLTLGLLAKFLLYSPWRARDAGIIITHLGILILLLGGLLTAFSQQEGFIMLREGQSGDAISDYHARVLHIEKDGENFADVPFEKIGAGEQLPLSLPFQIHIGNVCRNCQPVPVKDAKKAHGLAEQITLQDTKPDQSDEANLSGLVFTVSGANEQDGTYVLMEEIPHKPEITAGESTYTLSLGRAQTVLPFSITLKDFQRELHPGTDMARGFSSDVIVRDGTVEWPYHIRMNEPLRYKGYTFYQASFSLRPDGEYSILSAVTNKGRIFPYIASIVIFAGLLLHVLIRLKTAKERAA